MKIIKKLKVTNDTLSPIFRKVGDMSSPPVTPMMKCLTLSCTYQKKSWTMLLQNISKLRIKCEKSHGISATQSDCSGISIAITHTAYQAYVSGRRKARKASGNLIELLSITWAKSSLKTQKDSSNMQIAKKNETMPPFFT